MKTESEETERDQRIVKCSMCTIYYALLPLQNEALINPYIKGIRFLESPVESVMAALEYRGCRCCGEVKQREGDHCREMRGVVYFVPARNRLPVLVI